ncbi:MAG: hypothetical protein LBG74_02125 [Spirochaetaceae bacterium]|jgi:hypothetical protein|nr:hypothetical protein [Spirochaetaceae bacterium]
MKISSAIFIFFTIISPAFLNLSCWTLPVTQKPEENPRILLRTIPEQEPEWKNILPHDNNQIYFVGASRAFRTETDARNAAREDARIQILKYYGQYIKNTSKESTVLRGNSNDILNPYIERVDEFVSFAESVVKQIQADRYYTEV